MLLRSDRSIVRVRRPLPTSTLSIAPTRCRRPGATDTFFLVTLKLPRSWRAVDNHRLRLYARRFANAYLIDWYAYSHDHPGWFARDGYHLTASGQTAYAWLVARRIAAVR